MGLGVCACVYVFSALFLCVSLVTGARVALLHRRFARCSGRKASLLARMGGGARECCCECATHTSGNHTCTHTHTHVNRKPREPQATYDRSLQQKEVHRLSRERRRKGGRRRGREGENGGGTSQPPTGVPCKITASCVEDERSDEYVGLPY
jgi:hypothetical protein